MVRDYMGIVSTSGQVFMKLIDDKEELWINCKHYEENGMSYTHKWTNLEKHYIV